MRSGLQREEIEFIMGLFSYNETTDKPAAPKKQPVKADTKKVDTAQYKANYKATYLTQLRVAHYNGAPLEYNAL